MNVTKKSVKKPKTSKEVSVKNEVLKRIASPQKYPKYPLVESEETPSTTTIAYEEYTSTDETKSAVESSDKVNWAFWMKESQRNECPRENFEHILTIQDKNGNVVHELTFTDDDYYDAFLDIVQTCRKRQHTHPITTPTIHYATSHSNVQRRVTTSAKAQSHTVKTETSPVERKISAVLNQLVSKFDTLIATGQSVEHYYTEMAEKLRQLLPPPMQVAAKKTRLPKAAPHAAKDEKKETPQKQKPVEAGGVEQMPCSTQHLLSPSKTASSSTLTNKAQGDEQTLDVNEGLAARSTHSKTAVASARIRPPIKHAKRISTAPTRRESPGKISVGLQPKLKPANRKAECQIGKEVKISSTQKEKCGDEAPDKVVPTATSSRTSEKQVKSVKLNVPPVVDPEPEPEPAATNAKPSDEINSKEEGVKEDTETPTLKNYRSFTWPLNDAKKPHFIAIPDEKIKVCEEKPATVQQQPSRPKFVSISPQPTKAESSPIKKPNIIVKKTKAPSMSPRKEKKVNPPPTPAKTETPKSCMKESVTKSPSHKSTTLLEDLERSSTASVNTTDLDFDYSSLFIRLHREIKTFAEEQSLLKAQKLALGFLLNSSQTDMAKRSEAALSILQGKQSTTFSCTDNMSSQTTITPAVSNWKTNELSNRGSTSNADTDDTRTLVNEPSTSTRNTHTDTSPEISSSGTYKCESPMVLTVFKTLEKAEDKSKPTATPRPAEKITAATESVDTFDKQQTNPTVSDISLEEYSVFDPYIERGDYSIGLRQSRFETSVHLDTISEKSLEDVHLSEPVEGIKQVPPPNTTTTAKVNPKTAPKRADSERSRLSLSGSKTGEARSEFAADKTTTSRYSATNTSSATSNRAENLDRPIVVSSPYDQTDVDCNKKQLPLKIDQEYIRQRVLQLFHDRKMAQSIPQKKKHHRTAKSKRDQPEKFHWPEGLAPSKRKAEHVAADKLASAFKEEHKLDCYSCASVEYDYAGPRKPEVVEHQSYIKDSKPPRRSVFNQQRLLASFEKEKKSLVDEIMGQVRRKIKRKIQEVALPSMDSAEEQDSDTHSRILANDRGDSHHSHTVRSTKCRHRGTHQQTYSADDEGSASSAPKLAKDEMMCSRQMYSTVRDLYYGAPMQREVRNTPIVLDDTKPMTNFLLDKSFLKTHLKQMLQQKIKQEEKKAKAKKQKLAMLNAKFFSEENRTDNVPTARQQLAALSETTSEFSSDNGAKLRECPAVMKFQMSQKADENQSKIQESDTRREHKSSDDQQQSDNEKTSPELVSEKPKVTSARPIAATSTRLNENLYFDTPTTSQRAAKIQQFAMNQRKERRTIGSHTHRGRHKTTKFDEVTVPEKHCKYKESSEYQVELPSDDEQQNEAAAADAPGKLHCASANDMVSLYVKMLVFKLFQDRLLKAASQYTNSF